MMFYYNGLTSITSINNTGLLILLVQHLDGAIKVR